MSDNDVQVESHLLNQDPIQRRIAEQNKTSYDEGSAQSRIEELEAEVQTLRRDNEMILKLSNERIETIINLSNARIEELEKQVATLEARCAAPEEQPRPFSDRSDTDSVPEAD